uniref:Uncharacterized protein n=1 Tax=Salmo trutta TaxID=8032 RepID=A0A673Z8W9_SALTR
MTVVMEHPFKQLPADKQVETRSFLYSLHQLFHMVKVQTGELGAIKKRTTILLSLF